MITGRKTINMFGFCSVVFLVFQKKLTFFFNLLIRYQMDSVGGVNHHFAAFSDWCDLLSLLETHETEEVKLLFFLQLLKPNQN